MREALRNWQMVLEALCVSPEPLTLDLPHVRVDSNAKYEAALYLVEKGLLQQVGRTARITDDDRDVCSTATLYAPTEAGKLCWLAGFTDIKRQGKVKMKHNTDPTLAQRTVAIAHRDVFDLVRLPWTYSLRGEELREFPPDGPQ